MLHKYTEVRDCSEHDGTRSEYVRSLVQSERTQFEIEDLKKNPAQYLKLKETDRISWVRKAFALLDAYNGWDDNSNIENKALIGSHLKEVEKSSVVLSGIRSVLWAVESDMNGMMQIFKQENP